MGTKQNLLSMHCPSIAFFSLGGELYFDPAKCCQVVISCFALHNFCVRNGVPLPDEVNNQEQGPNLPERHENGAANDNRNGNMKRNRIAELYFG